MPLRDATDWRNFLSIRLQELGLLRKDFAAAVGRSEGWLSMVLAGRRLDPGTVPQLSAALRLEAEESEYFEALVDLENDSPRARRAAWAIVAATQRQRASAGLRTEEALALSRWYVLATLELARCDGFRPEAGWIAPRLAPPISIEEAAEALATLIRLGLLAPDESGRLVPRDVWLASELPPGEISVLFAAAHQATIELGKRAITTRRHNERHVSAVTVAVSEEHYDRVVARLRDLERDLVAFVQDDPGVKNRVYHLGIQWFPLSEYTDTDDQSIDARSQGPPPDIDPDTTE